jgi:hypothetical protein
MVSDQIFCSGFYSVDDQNGSVMAPETHLFFIFQVKFGHDVPLDRGNLQTSISEIEITILKLLHL